MKNQVSTLFLMMVAGFVAQGCMPMIMMDGNLSDHSSASKTTSEAITKVGNLHVKVTVSAVANREMKVLSTLTNAETGKLFDTAVVHCLVEPKGPTSHQMTAEHGESSTKDSIQDAHHEHWIFMESKEPGQFVHVFNAPESGSFRIQVRISSLDGNDLAEPVIIESTHEAADHSRMSMRHGMMGGLGEYGVIAVAGMIAFMAAAMAFRWF